MIRQFDVFRNPARGSATQPFVVSIQHKHLDHLATRLVAPLAIEQVVGGSASRLNPMFKIGGQSLYLLPQNLAAYPVQMLRDAVDNLEEERDRIIGAVDLMTTGV